VLDDIAVRPFLEQPAGESAVPFVVAAFQHIELDEGAGLAVHFPRRRGLARPQPHDGAADAQCLAGLQRQRARDAVAFVEQADLCDALGHRRARQAIFHTDWRLVARALFLIGVAGVLRGFRASTGGEQGSETERDQPPARLGGPGLAHVSGFQAS
jgi:hypothetical protein